MRRSGAAHTYSPKAYYFAVLSLVLLFAERGVAWTLSVPGNRLPTALAWITLCLAIGSTFLCIVYAYKGRREPASVKKGISWLLTLMVILFLTFVVYKRIVGI
jgi:hypothetical protein